MSLLATSAGSSQPDYQESPRSGWLRVLLAGIAMSQLFAFWLLCSHQVRKAEARHSEAVVQQMALSDCLQYIPGSTIASCAVRSDHAAQVVPTGAKPALSGAVPVNFSFR
jgi:hypothetical protein